MRRGEIYRTREKVAERGNKPGFYVVVSCNFVAGNDPFFSLDQLRAVVFGREIVWESRKSPG